MPPAGAETGGRPREAGVLRGAAAIIVLSVLLGAIYNFTGLRSHPAYGVPWIAKERTLEKVEDVLQEGSRPHREAAAATHEADADVPEIPDSGEPLQVQLSAVKRFVDAGAAMIVDAREPQEYDSGHIPGAVSLPYEQALPETLEALDAGPRPIITYCDGGTCELSMDLAWDLVRAGHSKVLVFMGGFPQWKAAGYPVETGEPTATETARLKAPAAPKDDPDQGSFSTDIDDPMAFFGPADGKAGLPQIPDLDRPMSMELATVKRFYDAGAAVLVDAREPEEYDAGHIPGAINLPWDKVVADPGLVTGFDAGGKPIIVYCGGGTCEVSMNVADALVAAGNPKVVVFTGGYPEWEAAGYPLAKGGARAAAGG